ncbi:BtrH N-terminal domain-containing protein [Halovenus sp. HT40]|uniref:BtrH N-terminal domain-containing protein n=1 Tax=Halovenus sp. HT40 TaxID=3126691 RepID=UPI00300E7371
MPRLDFDHETGAHCGSTSLRDLSTYYDWGFDEPTCFGLGEGLGFSYLELPTSPHRAIFGRTGWLERAFFENCGIEHTIHEGEAFEEAWAAIKERIDDGDPVMIFADLYYLDYYGTDTHFAPHSLLVVGYDDGEDGEYVHLADSEFAEIQRLPTDRLREALTSTHVVPLQCRYLTVDDPTVTVGFEEAAKKAIRETATYMLDPAESYRESKYFSGQGVGEIEAFAADLPEWSELPDPSWTIRFAYQNIERRGTGGGAFRRLFADFLETASEVVSLPEDAAEEMTGIADDWTELAGVLREASETESEADRQSLLWEASEQAGAVGQREAALYRRLREQ